MKIGSSREILTNAKRISFAGRFEDGGMLGLTFSQLAVLEHT